MILVHLQQQQDQEFAARQKEARRQAVIEEQQAAAAVKEKTVQVQRVAEEKKAQRAAEEKEEEYRRAEEVKRQAAEREKARDLEQRTAPVGGAAFNKSSLKSSPPELSFTVAGIEVGLYDVHKYGQKGTATVVHLLGVTQSSDQIDVWASCDDLTKHKNSNRWTIASCFMFDLGLSTVNRLRCQSFSLPSQGILADTRRTWEQQLGLSSIKVLIKQDTNLNFMRCCRHFDGDDHVLGLPSAREPDTHATIGQLREFLRGERDKLDSKMQLQSQALETNRASPPPTPTASDQDKLDEKTNAKLNSGRVKETEKVEHRLKLEKKKHTKALEQLNKKHAAELKTTKSEQKKHSEELRSELKSQIKQLGKELAAEKKAHEATKKTLDKTSEKLAATETRGKVHENEVKQLKQRVKDLKTGQSGTPLSGRRRETHSRTPLKHAPHHNDTAREQSYSDDEYSPIRRRRSGPLVGRGSRLGQGGTWVRRLFYKN